MSAGRILRTDLVELQDSLPEGMRVVVDLRATREVGDAVVVLVPREPSLDPSLLTPRERQVAELIARGLANKQIARALLISLGTVKDHVHRILVKTGLPNRAAVAARMR